MIRNGTVLTAAGQVFANGHVLLIDGRIAAVGEGLALLRERPAGVIERAEMEAVNRLCVLSA